MQRNNREKLASGFLHHLDSLVFHDDSFEHLAYQVPSFAEGQNTPIGAKSAHYLLPLATPLRLGRPHFRHAMGLHYLRFQLQLFSGDAKRQSPQLLLVQPS
jgi:hypothetical protein